MTLQQIKYIVTVAETGNITEAAKRLFIKIDSANSDSHKKAIALCSIFSGSTPVIFYDSSKSEYMSEPKLTVYPSEYVIKELKSFLGDTSVVFK